jgi:DNA-directed RNA polymerase subunit RPC12/RpoP
MDIALLIAMLLLVGVALLLVLYPLWQQSHSETVLPATDLGQQTLAEVESQYQAALAALKDLAFDYEMGKVSGEDYETLMAKNKLAAAKIRQRIDTLSQDAEDGRLDHSLDAEIEQLVADLRREQAPADEALLAEVEAEIERLKNSQKSPKAATPLTCHHCGKPLQAGDAFCSRCGQPVVHAEVEPEPEAPACPECGYAIQPGDAFCAKCGAALLKAEMANQSY